MRWRGRACAGLWRAACVLTWTFGMPVGSCHSVTAGVGRSACWSRAALRSPAWERACHLPRAAAAASRGSWPLSSTLPGQLCVSGRCPYPATPGLPALTAPPAPQRGPDPWAPWGTRGHTHLAPPACQVCVSSSGLLPEAGPHQGEGPGHRWVSAGPAWEVGPDASSLGLPREKAGFGPGNRGQHRAGGSLRRGWEPRSFRWGLESAGNARPPKDQSGRQ